jgi:hypothetical protein
MVLASKSSRELFRGRLNKGSYCFTPRLNVSSKKQRSKVMLILRPTGLSSSVYKDRFDYTVFEEGRPIGHMYEDHHAPAELRWSWSITVPVDPQPGIRMDGRTTTLDHAKEQFRRSWERVRVIPPTDHGPQATRGRR